MSEPARRRSCNLLEHHIGIGCNAARLDRQHPHPGKDTSMARLLVLYKTPKNPEAFDRHYQSVHIPLAKKVPGLKRYDISTGGVGTPAGKSDVYLIATLHFDTIDALKTGLGSAEGQAAAGDLANFADGGAELYIFETKDV
jgi:uncharacterized protein (TIGR02118 family)